MSCLPTYWDARVDVGDQYRKYLFLGRVFAAPEPIGRQPSLDLSDLQSKIASDSFSVLAVRVLRMGWMDLQCFHVRLVDCEWHVHP